MHWVAKLSDCSTVTNRGMKHGEIVAGEWGRLMERCSKEGLNVVEMAMPGIEEGFSIATPNYQQGYWHAYGLNSIQGVGDMRALGIGWVDELNVLHIIWRSQNRTWGELREAKGQIIWNDW